MSFNLVVFHSEGGHKDKGLDLTNETNIMLESAKDNFENISVYTPSVLKSMGYHYHVKEYENTGLISCNPGQQYIGFCAWKPLILLLELEKMNDGDILVYKDINCTKIPIYKDFNNIRSNVQSYLNTVNFDVFVPRNHTGWVEPFSNKYFCKTNIIRELGEDHPFSYQYAGVCVFFICIRKSAISIQLLKEWLRACENEKWINGEKYGELYEGFKWSCPEQSILNVILANWVRYRIHDIPINFPNIYFHERNLNSIVTQIDMNYLQYLNHNTNTKPILLDNTNDIEINITKCQKYMNDKLFPIINRIGEELEGHIFCCDIFKNKQRNISLISSKYNSVLEIGFNSGFSAVLMLLSNPNIKLTCVDIGIHKYVIPCYNQLKEDFGNRIELIIGDSTVVLPNLINNHNKYELIHIDGCHEVDIAEKDIINTQLLSIPGKTVIIMDDLNISEYHYSLVQMWIKYINKFKYNEVDFPLFYCRWHDIILV